ncbi:MAG: hypothetical protein RLZZ344_1140 [Pseudomonadota bacterium]|jgi:uncharacterized protein YqfA (UPF0365 family)
MKELDPWVFLAVFQEMLGLWLWIGLGAAVVVVALFARILMTERQLVSKRLVQAELAGLFGGGLALVVMAEVSSSGFTDAAGPADAILIALVYAAGFVATVITTYSFLGLWKLRATYT